MTHPEQHARRTFKDVRDLVEGAGLPERASARALEAFRLLAAAEGTVHGRDPEDVTFHEVGAVDSIVDVVGSCVALELLGAETVSCGPLPMGNGVVGSAHGLLPTPGPATLEVLKGSRVRWVEEPHETTTPTGAALMTALTGGSFSDAAPPMELREVGYGAGRIHLDNAPNLLRAVVGELEGSPGEVELLEANVDDAPGSSSERRSSASSQQEPRRLARAHSNETRPRSLQVCALVQSGAREDMARLLMRETGALGVRHLGVGRSVAERRVVDVELPYGRCRIKVGSLDGEDFVFAPSTPTPPGSRRRPASRARSLSDARYAFARYGTGQ